MSCCSGVGGAPAIRRQRLPARSQVPRRRRRATTRWSPPSSRTCRTANAPCCRSATFLTSASLCMPPPKRGGVTVPAVLPFSVWKPAALRPVSIPRTRGGLEGFEEDEGGHPDEEGEGGVAGAPGDGG